MERPIMTSPIRSRYAALILGFFACTSALAQEGQTYVRSSLYVPVRDGTRLAMNIYRPAVNGVATDSPMPVIFMFTPYRARYRNPAGNVVQLSQASSMGLMRLLDAGYVIAEADIRGKGASFGARRGFQDRTEARDGYDLVEWLASRPFSNGIVGMAGCSYLGGSTMHVATTAPPSLKAVFIGASDIDKFDFVRRGGITAQFNTRPDEPLSDDLMSIPVDEDSDGTLLQEAVAQHAGNTPMAPLWYSMPFRDSVSPLTGDAFWEEVGPYTYFDDLRKAGIATYFWGNLKDEPTSQVILAAANLDGKLLVGPGSHCAAPPDYDLGGEIQRFFDHHLKGIDNGIDREPRYTWWVENAPPAEHWQKSDDLPGAKAQHQFLFLGTGNGTAGALSTEKQPDGQETFPVDYDLGAGEYFAFWVDPQDEHGLTFTGSPLTRDLKLEGYPVVNLEVSADREDINVFAYLEEVDMEGKPQVLAMGRLAASYRATAPAPYDTLGLPWHPGRKQDHKPLVPGEPVFMQIALTPVSRIIPAGHQLRVTVTGADPRQRNLADIRQDPAPRITIHTGEDAGTRIELPVLK